MRQAARAKVLPSAVSASLFLHRVFRWKPTPHSSGQSVQNAHPYVSEVPPAPSLPGIILDFCRKSDLRFSHRQNHIGSRKIQTAGHGRILGFQGVAGHLDEARLQLLVSVDLLSSQNFQNIRMNIAGSARLYKAEPGSPPD